MGETLGVLGIIYGIYMLFTDGVPVYEDDGLQEKEE